MPLVVLFCTKAKGLLLPDYDLAFTALFFLHNSPLIIAKILSVHVRWILDGC